MSYILIIDDDDDFASAAATVLGEAGHEVSVKLEIKQAFDSMKERCPDLVILDVMFPESNTAGFELARSMRNNNGGALKDIPILMLTAVNSEFPLGFSSSDIDDKWMPVEDFLEKPIDLDMLSNKVSAMLNKA